MVKKILNSFWGPIVLGMHDALVSTLGLIAGLVFANATQYAIILTGIIAAVAAALSMTASQYLADKANNGYSNFALYHGLCTGGAYMFTATLLLIPFLLIKNTTMALTMTYILGVLIIWFFNLVKSKLNNDSFWDKFLEMLAICSVVTIVAFIIGECAKLCFGLQI